MAYKLTYSRQTKAPKGAASQSKSDKEIHQIVIVEVWVLSDKQPVLLI